MFSNKKAGHFIVKAINSGISNLLLDNENFDRQKLYITNSYVDQGPTMKRFRPAAMGRAVRILKRTSNLTVIISDKK